MYPTIDLPESLRDLGDGHTAKNLHVSRRFCLRKIQLDSTKRVTVAPK